MLCDHCKVIRAKGELSFRASQRRVFPRLGPSDQPGRPRAARLMACDHLAPMIGLSKRRS